MVGFLFVHSHLHEVVDKENVNCYIYHTVRNFLSSEFITVKSTINVLIKASSLQNKLKK